MKRSYSLMWMLAVVVGLAQNGAQASTCKIPMRSVLLSENECQYYETAFKMMGNKKVKVAAKCVRGPTLSQAGATYGAQIRTTLTVQGAKCENLKTIKVNPILLSRQNCSNLKNVVSLLSTNHVTISPFCQFGNWKGADGAPRTAMVKSTVKLHPQNPRNARLARLARR